MASNAIKMTVMGNIYIDTQVVNVMEHHMFFSLPLSTQVYRAIAPLLLFAVKCDDPQILRISFAYILVKVGIKLSYLCT